MNFEWLGSSNNEPLAVIVLGAQLKLNSSHPLYNRHGGIPVQKRR